MILYCTCNLAVQKSKFENVCNDLKFTCSAHSSVPVNLGQFILLYLTSVIIYLHNIFFPRFIHIHAIHMSGGGFADIKHWLNQLVCMYKITAYYKLNVRHITEQKEEDLGSVTVGATVAAGDFSSNCFGSVDVLMISELLVIRLGLKSSDTPFRKYVSIIPFPFISTPPLLSRI